MFKNYDFKKLNYFALLWLSEMIKANLLCSDYKSFTVEFYFKYSRPVMRFPIASNYEYQHRYMAQLSRKSLWYLVTSCILIASELKVNFFLELLLALKLEVRFNCRKHNLYMYSIQLILVLKALLTTTFTVQERIPFRSHSTIQSVDDAQENYRRLLTNVLLLVKLFAIVESFPMSLLCSRYPAKKKTIELVRWNNSNYLWLLQQKA